MKKYQIIAKSLKEDILMSKYDIKLPIEDELVKLYDTSKNTIRNATDLLVEEGLVYRVQGSGVYLRKVDHPSYINSNLIRGISKEFKGSTIETIVEEVSLVEAPEDIAQVLDLAPDKMVFQVYRKRLVDGIPYTIEYSYFSKKYIPYLNEDIGRRSIYDYIENDLGLPIGFADKLVTAEKLTKEDAAFFGVKEGDPALVINEKVYLSGGSLFDISRVIHNYTQAALYIAANN